MSHNRSSLNLLTGDVASNVESGVVNDTCLTWHIRCKKNSSKKQKAKKSIEKPKNLELLNPTSPALQSTIVDSLQTYHVTLFIVTNEYCDTQIYPIH